MQDCARAAKPTWARTEECLQHIALPRTRIVLHAFQKSCSFPQTRNSGVQSLSLQQRDLPSCRWCPSTVTGCSKPWAKCTVSRLEL